MDKIIGNFTGKRVDTSVRKGNVAANIKPGSFWNTLKEDFSDLSSVKKFNSQSPQKKFEITCIGGCLTSLILFIILNVILLKKIIPTASQRNNSDNFPGQTIKEPVKRNDESKSYSYKSDKKFPVEFFYNQKQDHGVEHLKNELTQRGILTSFPEGDAYLTNFEIAQSLLKANDEVIEKGGVNSEDIRGFITYVNKDVYCPVNLYSPSDKTNPDKSEMFLAISSKIIDLDGTDTNVTSAAGSMKDVFISEYGQFLHNQNRLSYKEMMNIWEEYVTPEVKRDINGLLSLRATESISANGKDIYGSNYVEEFFMAAITGKVMLTDKDGSKRKECDFKPTKEMIKLYIDLKGPAIPDILQGYIPGEPYDVDKAIKSGKIKLTVKNSQM